MSFSVSLREVTCHGWGRFHIETTINKYWQVDNDKFDEYVSSATDLDLDLFTRINFSHYYFYIMYEFELGFHLATWKLGMNHVTSPRFFDVSIEK